MGICTTRKSCCVVLLLLFVSLVSQSWNPSFDSRLSPFAAIRLDKYGGVADSPCVGGRRPQFYVEKDSGGRWSFCTPAGNRFFMLGVYTVGRYGSSYQSAVQAKYRSSDAWRRQTVLRLKSWGFNTLSIYWPPEVTPIAWGDGSANPEKMPFLHIFRMAGRAYLNRDGVGSRPVKSLVNMSCTNPPAPHLSCNHALNPGGNAWDVYDPAFAVYATNMAKTTHQSQGAYQADFPTSWGTGKQWVIGFVPDDSDNLTGLSGPGPEYPGRNGVVHYHVGHLVATAAPVQTNNRNFAALGCVPAGACNPYADTEVYSKLAWKDYLIRKYGTVAALNAAWGSDYTTFNVDKGYPRRLTGSKGLLDEDGSGGWLGTDLLRQTGANPNVVADLNAFLEQYAEKYYQTVAAAIRAANPGMLVFSNAPMNSNAGMTRREVLRAAGRWLDVLEVQHDPTRPVIARETFKETGRPMVTWTGFSANADSPFAGQPPAETYLDYPTQGARGSAYSDEMSSKFSLQAYDGSFPYIGENYWNWSEKMVDRTNFALVSFKDNAYDGKEAIIAPGKDPWGYFTGGEKKNYGDFVTAVKTAHLAVYGELLKGSAPPRSTRGISSYPVPSRENTNEIDARRPSELPSFRVKRTPIFDPPHNSGRIASGSAVSPFGGVASEGRAIAP